MSIVEGISDVNDPHELGQVLDQLRRQFHQPDLGLAEPPVRLGGGFWAEMWTLALTAPTGAGLPARVVLRLAPDAQLAVWETTFQTGVAAQGYPTPMIRSSNLTPTGAERAWCVMDHADGTPLLGGLSGLRALGALPRLATRLPDTLAGAAAELHRLDPEPLETALEGATDRTIGIDGLVRYYLGRAYDLADAALRRTLEHLAARRPDPKPRAICHGDLHPFNVLVDGEKNVVLDWTAGQIAHPAYDVAFTHLLLANPPLDAPGVLRPIVNAAARRIANRFLTTYAKIGPHPIDADALDWYGTLHTCRIMSDIATWRAAGALDAHRGHPWLAMEPALRLRLTS